jgi:hypothetical protein
MKYFYMHPNDVRWLCRWFRSNLLCIVAITCFLLMIRLVTSTPPTSIAHCEVLLDCDLPQETEMELLTSRQLRPVAPEGWRLTNKGWEHASTWPPLPRPLGEIIKDQQDREPAWLQLTLAKLRGVPPLIFALMQLTAVTAIVNTSRNSREEKGSGTNSAKHPPGHLAIGT